MPHALIARAVKLLRLNAFLRVGIMATGAWPSHVSSLITTWRPASANPVIVRGAASFTPLADVGINKRTAPVTGNRALACRDWKYTEICGTRFNNMVPMTNNNKNQRIHESNKGKTQSFKRPKPSQSSSDRSTEKLEFEPCASQSQ